MKRKTHEEFVNEVYHNRGNIYIFHSEYINAKTKIDVECKLCGKRYMADPRQLLKNITVVGCKYCSHSIITPRNKGYKLPKKYTTDSFGKIVSSLTNREYELLGEYTGIKKKTTMKHLKCGNIYEVTPDHFIHEKTRCPICFGNLKKTTSRFKKEVHDLVADEYTVIGKYKTAREKIKIKHNACGHIYNVIPDSFLRGSRCPRCFKSKGELKIFEYLEKNNVQFLEEYTFDNLLSDLGNPLRFDFAIFKDNILIQLIEYDGELHYNEEYSNYKTLKLHDNRKDQYCNENNISLTRIPYWEFDNINKILDEEILFSRKMVVA